MSLIQTSFCDGCGDPLEGKVKAADVHKKHLVISGKLNVEEYHEESRRTVFKKVFDPRDRDLHFCNTECLKNLIETREASFDKAIETGDIVLVGINDNKFPGRREGYQNGMHDDVW